MKGKVDNPLFCKEDVYDIRGCLGTPYSCVNCESKGIFEANSGPNTNTCSPVPLKRCSGCHLVAYWSQVKKLKYHILQIWFPSVFITENV